MKDTNKCLAKNS